MDKVCLQAARIHQAVDSSVGLPCEGKTADGTETTKLSELRPVINYLRMEILRYMMYQA